MYKPFQPTLTASSLRHFGIRAQQFVLEQGVLAEFVHSFLQISVRSATPYPVIPDASQAIYISPEGARIAGTASESFNVEIPRAGEYFGIRFYPRAFTHFFNVDLSRTNDKWVDLTSVSRSKSKALIQRIYSCEDFYQRSFVCQQWLLQHLHPRRDINLDRALRYIYRFKGGIKISNLLHHVQIGHRQLNRLFRGHTGLSCKRFSQIIRLQYACRRLWNQTAKSADVAQELGYCDQSHLIKEFRKFLQTHPRRFRETLMSSFYNK